MGNILLNQKKRKFLPKHSYRPIRTNNCTNCERYFNDIDDATSYMFVIPNRLIKFIRRVSLDISGEHLMLDGEKYKLKKTFDYIKKKRTYTVYTFKGYTIKNCLFKDAVGPVLIKKVLNGVNVVYDMNDIHNIMCT